MASYAAARFFRRMPSTAPSAITAATRAVSAVTRLSATLNVVQPRHCLLRSLRQRHHYVGTRLVLLHIRVLGAHGGLGCAVLPLHLDDWAKLERKGVRATDFGGDVPRPARRIGRIQRALHPARLIQLELILRRSQFRLDTARHDKARFLGGPGAMQDAVGGVDWLSVTAALTASESPRCHF